MFKNPFSFRGRIRRTEYGLSTLILLFVFIFIAALSDINEDFALFLLPITIGAYWFGLAQGAKRAHDMNLSGWMQLVPFFGLALLFGNGNAHENKYGPDPKVEGNQVVIPQEPFTFSDGLPEGKTGLSVLNEMLCFILLVTMLFAMISYAVPFKGFVYLLDAVIIIAGYFLLLEFTHKDAHIPHMSKYLLRHRWLFSGLLSICIITFEYYFENRFLEAEVILSFIVYTGAIFLMTLVALLIYRERHKTVMVYE